MADSWYGGGIIFWYKSYNVSKYKQSFGRVKENQLDARRILYIFRKPVRVLDVSRPIIGRYNRNQTGQQTVI